MKPFEDDLIDSAFEITERKVSTKNSTKEAIVEMLRNRWVLENRAVQLESEVNGLDGMTRELRDRADRSDYQQRELLKNLAKVVDECDDLLSAEALRTDSAAAEDPAVLQSRKWCRRIERTREHLMERLKSYGVTTRNPVGVPNPDLDTVYGIEETAAVAPGDVVKILRAGLLWNGTVLRCSVVLIAAPPQ